MPVLVWMILAHVLADFYLQPRKWVVDREKNHVKSSALYKHTLVHALLTAGALAVGVSMNLLSLSWGLILAWCAIWVSHYFIDLAKSYTRPSATSLLLDQLAHVLVIVVVWSWLTDSGSIAGTWLLNNLFQPDALIFLTIYLLAARPVSFFTAAVLSKQAAALRSESHGLVEAGRLIGFVERWLIISFVLTGQFIGVGFLLAAKSIFRFGDLSQAHERRLTEYMLLGTLVSFASAIALGWLALYLT